MTRSDAPSDIPKAEKHKSKHVPEFDSLFGYGTAKNAGANFLSKIMRRDWLSHVYSTFVYVLQSSPAWFLPIVTSNVIDLVTTQPTGYVTMIIVELAILVALLALNIPTTIWRSNIVNKWIRKTTAEIKGGIIRKLQRLSITYHKEMEEGRIQSKFLRDIESVNGYFAMVLNQLVLHLVGAIISAIIAITTNLYVAGFFVIIVPANIIFTKMFRKKMSHDNNVYRMENERLSSKVTTTLQMMTITKAHGLISNEEHLLDEKINAVTNAGNKLDRTIAGFGSVMWVVSEGISLSCLALCIVLAINGYISIGEIVLFQTLFTRISSSVLGVINCFPSLIAGHEAAASLSELICADDIEKADGSLPVPVIKGQLEFENVCYHYPSDDKLVVDNFSLSVKQGETIAIVGASGSGKSTLMNLIIGLLSPSSGRILVDGIDMSELNIQSYRHYISVVPQNSILFSGTIKDNITYGLSSYTNQDLEKVLVDASISEFLPSLPNGVDSQVGERGDKLSGGQKQRVSIARALIRNPKILIMDEATSALDNVSEYHIQKAIDKLMQDRTTFVVAHRLSTIRNADRIVVMDEGKMIEIGTYDELIALGGKFTELDKLSKQREAEAVS